MWFARHRDDEVPDECNHKYELHDGHQFTIDHHVGGLPDSENLEETTYGGGEADETSECYRRNRRALVRTTLVLIPLEAEHQSDCTDDADNRHEKYCRVTTLLSSDGVLDERRKVGVDEANQGEHDRELAEGQNDFVHDELLVIVSG